MIESNDGKINSSGLVSGLSRADFIGGSCARRARPRPGWTDPLDRTTAHPTSDRARRPAHDVWDRRCEWLCVPVAVLPSVPTSACS